MATQVEEKAMAEEENVQLEEEEEEEEEEFFTDIEKIQDFGVNVSEIKKLKDAGIMTIAGIRMATDKALLNIKGITEAKLNKIRDSAAKLESHGFFTGTELSVKRKRVLKISTGSTALNDLLRGGLESMSITEVFGEFRTGKTQLCHTACVTAQLPPAYGGGNGKVLFIDTEGTFRPQRIISIAERFNVDPTAVLDNITVARAYTSDHQMQLLQQVVARLHDDHHSLLIVDSATALFRVDYLGRGQLAERQQKLGSFLSGLNKIADQFNVAVLITNQVVSDPGGGAMFVTDAKKPIGGHIMAHACTTRLFLRKGRSEQRICKIYDSPSLPEAEAVFCLTEGGVDDAKD